MTFILSLNSKLIGNKSKFVNMYKNNKKNAKFIIFTNKSKIIE